MPESAIHIKLVESMESWVAKNYFSGERGFILIDHPESTTKNKPPMINSFVPDLYVCKTTDYGIIIGEAKTISDIENKHTEEQIKTFLGYLSRREKGVFIFAVPWSMTRFANNFLKRLQQQTYAFGVNIVVLSKLPG